VVSYPEATDTETRDALSSFSRRAERRGRKRRREARRARPARKRQGEGGMESEERRAAPDAVRGGDEAGDRERCERRSQSFACVASL